MLTLFNVLVMSQLDNSSQLWSPYLTEDINIIKKTKWSFTRNISGMQGLSYPERLWSAKFQTPLLLYILEHLIVEENHVLHLTLVLDSESILNGTIKLNRLYQCQSNILFITILGIV